MTKKYFWFIFIALCMLGGLMNINTVEAVSGVDLTMESISISPNDPAPGESVTIIIWGRNIGNKTLTDNTGIGNASLYIQDFDRDNTGAIPASPSPLVDPLSPGDVFSITVTGSFNSYGNKSINFHIDHSNELVELNDDNNAIVGHVSVPRSSDTRDLRLTDIIISPSMPIVGQPVTITVKGMYWGDVILHNGSGLGSFTMGGDNFQLDSDGLVAVPMPTPTDALWNGRPFEYVLKGKFKSAGSTSFSFTTNANGELAESTRSNNSFQKNLFVLYEGDLIKVVGDAGIYKIEDGKRCLFSNAVTFRTHYDGTWSDIYNIEGTGILIKTIKTISQYDFNNLSRGDNMTIKPGEKLIKFKNSSLIYIVYNTNKLKLITNQEASSIFGDSYGDEISIIQVAFESDYDKNDADFMDTDGDGLADEDEINFHNTDENNNDSDEDGYKDGAEVLSGYNPRGDVLIY